MIWSEKVVFCFSTNRNKETFSHVLFKFYWVPRNIWSLVIQIWIFWFCTVLFYINAHTETFLYILFKFIRFSYVLSIVLFIYTEL